MTTLGYGDYVPVTPVGYSKYPERVDDDRNLSVIFFKL